MRDSGGKGEGLAAHTCGSNRAILPLFHTNAGNTYKLQASAPCGPSPGPGSAGCESAQNNGAPGSNTVVLAPVVPGQANNDGIATARVDIIVQLLLQALELLNVDFSLDADDPCPRLHWHAG